jgi:long-chain fatty acid transport protein
MFKRALQLAAIGIVGLATAHQAFASGYEKSIMWGGRSAGLAGIASPWVSGSQSLYFNPAGLVRDQKGQDVSLAISPTMAKFSAPINNNNDTSTAETTTVTPFGLLYGNTFDDKFAVGAGYFISAGANANYQNVDMGTFGDDYEVKTDLMVSEFSVGAAYKVNDKLKLGGAVRIVSAKANFSFITRPNAVEIVNAKLTDLQDKMAPGFRLGAQYKVDDATTVGFNYRSQLNLQATGRIGGKVNGVVDADIADAPATASTVFPQQVTLGADHAFSDVWRGFFEYAWTQYSAVDILRVTTTTTAGAINIVDPEVTQNWKDQHNVRLAAEYTGCHMPIRFGYGWTSQVTDKDFARASFTPPGQGHTLTLGSGITVGSTEKPINLDWAYEYTRVVGDGNGAAAGATTGDVRTGEYKVEEHALHLAAAYNF